MDIKDSLTKFIGEDLLNGQSVGENENLLLDGMIDSVGVMRLVAYIEESLGIKVPPEDFTIENFGSIHVISDYLQQNRNATDPHS